MTQRFKSFDRITVDPDVLGGKPCIRSLRLSVERVLDILSQNPSWDHLQQDYPDLQREDIEQVLRFAAANLGDQIIPLDLPAA